MRLIEIFTTTTSDLDQDDSIPTADHGTGGVFAFAKQSDDPHMVDKHHKSSSKKTQKSYRMLDAFPYYAKIIYENQLWDEIHFPRIYHVTRATTEDGGFRYSWNMEKLYDFKDLDVEEMDALSQKYFGGVGANDSEANYPKMFSRFIKNSFIYGRNDGISDEQLYACVDLLHSMKEPIYKMAREDIKDYDVELDLFEDLHTGNIMVRRTNTGPQIVLTDPFAFNVFTAWE